MRIVCLDARDRGQYRFAGDKGYVSDDATGFRMLGAR